MKTLVMRFAKAFVLIATEHPSSALGMGVVWGLLYAAADLVKHFGGVWEALSSLLVYSLIALSVVGVGLVGAAVMLPDSDAETE